MSTQIFLALISTAIAINASQAQVSIRDLQRNPGVSISGIVRSVVGNEFILDSHSDPTRRRISPLGAGSSSRLKATPFSVNRPEPLSA